MVQSHHADTPGDWRSQRRAGMAAIAGSALVAALLWLGIRYLAPPVSGMEALSARMLFTLKCCCVAVLFCLVSGVEAVAHERLQSPAFDPLQGHETRRLSVNLRYLQNTLEQTVVFVVGLFGHAVYCADGAAMRGAGRPRLSGSSPASRSGSAITGARPCAAPARPGRR